MSPLILTLELDPMTFAVLDQLRQQHFPPERNFLSAHVTLFHALPSEEETSIQQTLEQVCLETSTLVLEFPKVRSLGRGVAIEMDAPALVQLRNRLATCWIEWLTPQDRQAYRPHVTIQNKASSEAAQQLYRDLDQQWQPMKGQGEGLLLWTYQGGPWTLVRGFQFKSASSLVSTDGTA